MKSSKKKKKKEQMEQVKPENNVSLQDIRTPKARNVVFTTVLFSLTCDAVLAC